MGIIGDIKALRRSWRIYHGDRDRDRGMDGLYANFLSRGDLAFDVGAHVGHRTASFLRLGAKVVAVEPQRLPAALISAFWGWRGAKVERAACGAHSGVATMHVNSANPIVSTLSSDFVAASQGAAGWEGQSWDRAATTRVVTLDELIAHHGRPAFIKIDVEGFESEALAGLSAPVPALSFEFTTIQRAVAFECLDQCASLGFTRFNAVIGETHTFALEDWTDAQTLRSWLAELPHEANSGDVYARFG